jgi:hypothetical protein
LPWRLQVLVLAQQVLVLVPVLVQRQPGHVLVQQLQVPVQRRPGPVLAQQLQVLVQRQPGPALVQQRQGQGQVRQQQQVHPSFWRQSGC